MYRNLLLLFAAFSGSFFTQAASLPVCQDPWVANAFRLWGQTPRNIGTGFLVNGVLVSNIGDCSTNNYGGATWGNYTQAPGPQAMLNLWVVHSRDCADPWLGEAYATLGRTVNALQCSTAWYGSWSSFPQLVGLVQQFLSPPVKTVPNKVSFISTMGSKCLGVPNSSTSQGTQLILWNCDSTKTDQSFKFVKGQIHAYSGNVDLCVDDAGGLFKVGDHIQTYPCESSNSIWSLNNGQLRKVANGQLTNMCIDLTGGTWTTLGIYYVQLNTCGTSSTQHFNAAIVVPAGSSASLIPPGSPTQINPSPGAAVVSNDGGSIVASGAGNLISQDGGGIIGINSSGFVGAGLGNVASGSNTGMVFVPIASNLN